LIAEVKKGTDLATTASNSLKALTNGMLNNSNAAEMITADELYDHVESEENAKLKAAKRRASELIRRSQMKNIHDKYEVSKSSNESSSENLPALKELMASQMKYGASVAFQKMRDAQKKVNARQSLKFCLTVVTALIFSQDGCDKLTTADLKVEIDLARQNGLDSDEFRQPEEVMRVAQKQVSIIAGCLVALKTGDVVTMEKVIAEASQTPLFEGRSYISQLRIYKEMTEILEEKKQDDGTYTMFNDFTSVFSW